MRLHFLVQLNRANVLAPIYGSFTLVVLDQLWTMLYSLLKYLMQELERVQIAKRAISIVCLGHSYHEASIS